MVKLRTLSDASLDELIQALESTHVASDAGQMTECIHASVPSIDQADLKEILDALYSIYYAREMSHSKQSQFLNDLVHALRESQDPALKIDGSEVPAIRERLRRLLTIRNLDVLSKAVSLQYGGERLYCNAKILSDIRPVFGEQVEESPEGAVITHTLKLGYHEGGEHKTFFVILDEEDLDSLAHVIERAQSKRDTLSSLLSKAGLAKLGI